MKIVTNIGGRRRKARIARPRSNPCWKRSIRSGERICRVVWPVHPRTRNFLRGSTRLRTWLEDSRPHFRMIEPLGYLDMVAAEAASRLIVTDSGGVQKEAFFHRVPCVTLRTETEWVSRNTHCELWQERGRALVDAGWNARLTCGGPGAESGAGAGWHSSTRTETDATAALNVLFRGPVR